VNDPPSGVLRTIDAPRAHASPVAESPAMRQLVEMARRVAPADAAVLITGESGSGKERIARLLHDGSQRASGPWIALHCGAIGESALEAEPFGQAYEHAGLFEAADGGTLFLDEVDEISPGMQAKLLRALRRAREDEGRRIAVRIVAATHRDLAHDAATGAFRQDLYYRLKVVELRVPPLRERTEDVLPLARELLGAAAGDLKREVPTFGADVAEQLLRYRWPGNVRELKNTMERCAALARGPRVELDDLPSEILQASSQPPRVVGPVRPLHEIEREYILAALASNSGNQTRTAEQLQIGVATLYRKLKLYRLGGSLTEAARSRLRPRS
jgi:DNA-binding NtrC family response regulator